MSLGLLAALALGAPRAFGAPADTMHFERSVAVDAPGVVRVPLEPAIMARLRAGWPDLRVFDPEGNLVPFRITEAAPPPANAAPAISAVEEASGERWLVTVDLGDPPGSHRALLLPFDDPGAAFDVALEASHDGARWTPLAQATLFNLGATSAVQDFRIDYPPSTDRYLRFNWPLTSGVPRFSDLSVERVAPERLAPWTLPIDPRRDAAQGAVASSVEPAGARVDAAAGGAEWTLAGLAPGQPVDGLEITWRGPRNVAYRLEEAAGGAWTTAAAGILTAPGDAGDTWRARVATGAGQRHGPLRLTLYGGAGVPVAIEGVAALIAPRWVTFEARRGGTFELRYGSPVASAPETLPQGSPADTEAVDVSAGPETELAPVEDPLARAPFAPAAAVDLSAFSLTLPVTTTVSGSAPALHRVAVPAAVYASARRDLGDVRLVTEERQIPYLRQAAPDPEAVAAALGAHPVAVEGAHSQVAITVPYGALPITELVLRTPSHAFTRDVTLFAHDPRRGATLPVALARAQWQCAGASELPCEISLPLAAAPAGPLTIDLTDNEDLPLDAIDAVLWRRRDDLVFAWPGITETARPGVSLVAGDPTLTAPRYDLAQVPDLLNAPAAAAEVTAPPEAPAEATPEVVGSDRMLQLAILVAAVVLFGLLANMLLGGRGPAGSPGEPT